MYRLEIDGGKYTIELNEHGGIHEILRYDGTWIDETRTLKMMNMVAAMAREIKDLREKIDIIYDSALDKEKR